MYKNFTICLVFTLLLAFSFSGCSRQLADNQIQFGVQAAQKELWDEAIFRWKKVIESNPNSAAAHNNLAVAYEKKGLWDEAKKEYEIALKISPENKHIKSNYENFIKNYESFKKEKEDEKT